MSNTVYTVYLSAKNFHGHLTAEEYYLGSYYFSDRRDAKLFYDPVDACNAADNAYKYIIENNFYLGLKSIYVTATSCVDDEGELINHLVYEVNCI